MSGGFLRGTSAQQDSRFSDKTVKLLKTQKFAPELEHQVDMSKVKLDVIRPWIARRVTDLLGFEDEVLINFIYSLLDGKSVDGKFIQIQITGFMEKNTGRFMKELWCLLLSAQNNITGIPQQFLDAKVEESMKKAEDQRIISEALRKREEEKNAERDLERKASAVEAAKSTSLPTVPQRSREMLSHSPDGKRNRKDSWKRLQSPNVWRLQISLATMIQRKKKDVEPVQNRLEILQKNCCLNCPFEKSSKERVRGRFSRSRSKSMSPPPRSLSRSPRRSRRRHSKSFSRSPQRVYRRSRSPARRRRPPSPMWSPPRRRRSPVYSPRRRRSPPTRYRRISPVLSPLRRHSSPSFSEDSPKKLRSPSRSLSRDRSRGGHRGSARPHKERLQLQAHGGKLDGTVANLSPEHGANEIRDRSKPDRHHNLRRIDDSMQKGSRSVGSPRHHQTFRRAGGDSPSHDKNPRPSISPPRGKSRRSRSPFPSYNSHPRPSISPPRGKSRRSKSPYPSYDNNPRPSISPPRGKSRRSKSPYPSYNNNPRPSISPPRGKSRRSKSPYGSYKHSPGGRVNLAKHNASSGRRLEIRDEGKEEELHAFKQQIDKAIERTIPEIGSKGKVEQGQSNKMKLVESTEASRHQRDRQRYGRTQRTPDSVSPDRRHVPSQENRHSRSPVRSHRSSPVVFDKSQRPAASLSSSPSPRRDGKRPLSFDNRAGRLASPSYENRTARHIESRESVEMILDHHTKKVSPDSYRSDQGHRKKDQEQLSVEEHRSGLFIARDGVEKRNYNKERERVSIERDTSSGESSDSAGKLPDYTRNGGIQLVDYGTRNHDDQKVMSSMEKIDAEFPRPSQLKVDEKRKIGKEFKSVKMDSDSESEERHKAKKRRKEEKRLRREMRRRKREEKHKRKEERRAAKASFKEFASVTPPPDFEREDNRLPITDVAAGCMDKCHEEEDIDNEQKRLENELRKKALDSLRQKKGVSSS